MLPDIPQRKHVCVTVLAGVFLYECSERGGLRHDRLMRSQRRPAGKSGSRICTSFEFLDAMRST